LVISMPCLPCPWTLTLPLSWWMVKAEGYVGMLFNKHVLYFTRFTGCNSVARPCLIAYEARKWIWEQLVSFYSTFKNEGLVGQTWWHVPIIPAMWEVEIRAQGSRPTGVKMSEISSQHIRWAWIRES
jgi:hypothetical protein